MLNIKKLYNNWNLNLLNIIKLSYCSRVEYIYLQIVKKNIILLKILKKYNFISSFKFISDNIVIVYFLYKNNKKIWLNLKIMYKSSHFFYIDTYILRRFYKYEFKKLLFLLTDQGLIDHHLALKKNIGGKLYFILY